MWIVTSLCISAFQMIFIVVHVFAEKQMQIRENKKSRQQEVIHNVESGILARFQKTKTQVEQQNNQEIE